MWQSADPILGQYLPNTPKKSEEDVVKLIPPSVGSPLARFDLPGQGGVYASSNLGLYSYGHLNPLMFRDPDGNVVDVSEEMKPIVDNLRGDSPTAAKVLDTLHADPRKFYIRQGSHPSGGSAGPVRAPQPSLFERLFLGKKAEPDRFLITITPLEKIGQGYNSYDEKGNIFHSSLERNLAHELGHALIWAVEGDVALSLNQEGAIKLENVIARELDPKAPLRHPTMGHGRIFP